MKKLLLMTLLGMGICNFSQAQYIPASGTETSLGSPNPINGIYNVGIDTRSDPADVLYRNATNVMVSDYLFGVGNPVFYWDIVGYNGSYTLPSDAVDPDVTLIEGDPGNAWAIIVYYSATMGGYCMSFSQVTPTMSAPYSMLPLTSPTLIQAYTPTAGYPPYINIDADDAGHYAVVYQMAGAIRCGTGTMSSGSYPPPPYPTNITSYLNLMEPDVAISYTSATPRNIKIISLRTDRNGYEIHERAVSGTAGASYISPLGIGKLYNPRIACTRAMLLNYAYTMQQRLMVGSTAYSNILFDTYDAGLGGFSGLMAVNDGSTTSYPTANNTYNNAFPAITYHSDPTITPTEIISLAWYTDMLPAPPSAQPNTMMGLDINGTTLQNFTPGNYLDVSSTMTATNNASTIALSGRYSFWAKSAVFAYGTAAIPNLLVWKNVGSTVGSWRKVNEETTLSQLDNSKISLYPNPVSGQLILNMDNDKNYTYKVYNSIGQVMTEGALNQKASIDVQNWSIGNYFIRVIDDITQEQQTQGFSKL